MKTTIHSNSDRRACDNMKAYDVEITLFGSQPEISRNLIIPQGLTFKDLERIIQKAFSFDGYHSSEFIFENTNETVGSDKTAIVDKYLKNNETFYYHYDFGDDWLLLCSVNDITEYDKSYTIFRSYNGDYNPIEDCGGVIAFNMIVNDRRRYSHFRLRKINPKAIQRALMKIRAYNFKAYDVKIRYSKIDDLYWRDFLIPQGTTFKELEDMIKIAFENEDVSFNSGDGAIDNIFNNSKKIYSANYDFTVEIKAIVEYDREYPTLKRFQGGNDPFEKWYEYYPYDELELKKEDKSQSRLDDFF